jgi:hypothetical protein
MAARSDGMVLSSALASLHTHGTLTAGGYRSKLLVLSDAMARSALLVLSGLLARSPCLVLSGRMARSYVMVLSDLLARFHNIGQFGGAM